MYMDWHFMMYLPRDLKTLSVKNRATKVVVRVGLFYLGLSWQAIACL